MRAIARLVGKQMLHIQAGLRAFEDNWSIHDEDMRPTGNPANYGCLRRSLGRNSSQLLILPASEGPRCSSSAKYPVPLRTNAVPFALKRHAP
ncbi:MAG: hypothetical protein JHD07_20355 [Bradyrhizobium sp.]|uniref:hypothetical protein n=1 Tax=Bradyrhizobium sp. TaxID=376 RepID=UPI001A2CFAB8|nr:hypothetical protein [Bradyrhizobium sp.]MBJ7405529.1 hypothetical protein [Bradyrhizobium sp.]